MANSSGDDSAATFGYAGATIDITPTRSTPLAGYSGRLDPFTGISSRLEASAALIARGTVRVLFISADLLFFGSDLVAAVTARAKQFNLTEDQVILVASHTHFAPGTDRSKPRVSRVVSDYYRFVEDRLLDLVNTVMSSAVSIVTLNVSHVATDLTVVRRRRWLLPVLDRAGAHFPPNIVMAPAFGANCDRELSVIRAVDQDGAIRAVFWKFACHPVCFPEVTAVSAEYPGYARSAVRRWVGRNVPVIFWQGFAGDVRPLLGADQPSIWHLRAFRKGPSFRAVNLSEWRDWADRLTEALIVAVGGSGHEALAGPLAVASANVPISTLVSRTKNSALNDRTMRIQRVSFGVHLNILFVSAEVCSPYLNILRWNDRTICVGYVGDVFGYLPSARQAKEGGYEGRDFLASFGLSGQMRPGFEDVVRLAVAGLKPEPTIKRPASVEM